MASEASASGRKAKRVKLQCCSCNIGMAEKVGDEVTECPGFPLRDPCDDFCVASEHMPAQITKVKKSTPKNFTKVQVKF